MIDEDVLTPLYEKWHEDEIFDLNGHIEIGDYDFEFNQQIKKIIIGSTLQKLGHCSFKFNPNIEEIDFTNTILKEIGEGCFFGCGKIKKIELPESINIINNASFAQCSNLKEIYLSNVIEINGYAFYDCKNLEKIEISDSISFIGPNSFKKNDKIINITCPNQFFNFFQHKFPNAILNEYCKTNYILK